MGIGMVIAIAAAALIIGALAGVLVHVAILKAMGVKSATAANKIKSDAQREAERLLREARVTAKSDVLKIKEEFESEMKDRRREL